MEPLATTGEVRTNKMTIINIAPPKHVDANMPTSLGCMAQAKHRTPTIASMKPAAARKTQSACVRSKRWDDMLDADGPTCSMWGFDDKTGGSTGYEPLFPVVAMSWFADLRIVDWASFLVCEVCCGPRSI